MVRGGRAVTALSESAMVPGMREVCEAEGFPPLPLVEIRVERSRAKESAELRELERLFAAGLA